MAAQGTTWEGQGRGQESCTRLPLSPLLFWYYLYSAWTLCESDTDHTWYRVFSSALHLKTYNPVSKFRGHIKKVIGKFEYHTPITIGN